MDMEEAFEDFLEKPAYDEAEAAGGKKPEKNITVLPYHDSPK